MQTHIEAISPNDRATIVAPIAARMPPYTIDAGPPFKSEN
jgi:hypothetical protein